MRVAAALFIAAHGVGYILWFMASWTPAALGTRSKQLSIGEDVVTGGLGKAIGLVALVVIAGFLVAAWGVWQQAPWWPTVLVVSAVAAFPTAFAVWNPVANVSVMAGLANVGLLAATFMPWGERLLGAH
jgi:hypothetical protein